MISRGDPVFYPMSYIRKRPAYFNMVDKIAKSERQDLLFTITLANSGRQMQLYHYVFRNLHARDVVEAAKLISFVLGGKRRIYGISQIEPGVVGCFLEEELPTRYLTFVIFDDAIYYAEDLSQISTLFKLSPLTSFVCCNRSRYFAAAELFVGVTNA